MTTNSLSRSQSGFTLLEVALAVMILSSALITLLGLQSAILKRTLRDDEKQRAMLIARSILSALELQNEEIEIQDKTQPAEDLLKSLNAIPPRENKDQKDEVKFRFMAHLKVEAWGIPKLGDNLLRRVNLTIFTDEAQAADGNPEDAFEVLYFVPNNGEDEQ